MVYKQVGDFLQLCGQYISDTHYGVLQGELSRIWNSPIDYQVVDISSYREYFVKATVHSYPA